MHIGKLQLVEAMQKGHHTNYLLALLPGMIALKESGLVDSLVVTITPLHFELLTEAGHVARFGPSIEWDTSLPFTSPAPSWSERWKLHAAVRASVSSHRPDALICTSSDVDILQNATLGIAFKGMHWPQRSAGIVHYGYPKGSLLPREELKRVVYETGWKLSNWQKILFVNPLIYEGFLERHKDIGGRYDFLPDPVPALAGIDREEARAELGLPADATLIGCVGMMDHRRAVPELLSAFLRSEQRFDPAVRMVLAGRLDHRYRELIDSTYSEDVANGRLIVIDRMLSDREISCGYAALDLHSMLQYRRFNLSANVLKCIAAGKPFVCDEIGHGQMVAERFDAGIVCKVGDSRSISLALSEGLRRAQAMSESTSKNRLIEFHDIDNFARIALASVVGEEVYDVLGPACPWQHAYGQRRPTVRVPEGSMVTA